MDLFEYNSQQLNQKKSPLAYRMRPRTLEEFEGQEDIVGPGTLLERAIRADRLGSILLYGPPGTGKTTLAHIIANTTKAAYHELNAVTAGKKDIEADIQEARDRLGLTGTGTILFIDEIHRFNKAQQDALLPAVEKGLVTLIGATTENPYFEVNKALLSRSRIFQLKPLSRENLMRLLQRACRDAERGLGDMNISINDDALHFLADMAGGDARTALNALELAAVTTLPNAEGRVCIDLEAAQSSIQKKAFHYDKNGDRHYDILSAFQKSIRGSDPDAAVYYLACLIEGGDLESICRRLLVIASEDIGMAYPNAVVIVKACCDAALQTGLPEARINLAQAVLTLATAPKSNSAAVAIDAALSDLHSKDTGEIPSHLKDAHYSGASKLGNGTGYRYPHDFPNHYVKQQYLPEALADTVYYRAGDNKTERAIEEYLKKLKQ
ncbi:MAG: replication-associated recombination protein A [Lachnospiraceae bacterium]|nr:replication-associated recombination protein A [Lachnospiraceae bacterium]